MASLSPFDKVLLVIGLVLDQTMQSVSGGLLFVANEGVVLNRDIHSLESKVSENGTARQEFLAAVIKLYCAEAYSKFAHLARRVEAHLTAVLRNRLLAKEHQTAALECNVAEGNLAKITLLEREAEID